MVAKALYSQITCQQSWMNIKFIGEKMCRPQGDLRQSVLRNVPPVHHLSCNVAL